MDLRSRENSKVNSFFINCLITWWFRRGGEESRNDGREVEVSDKEETELSSCVCGQMSGWQLVVD